MAATETVEKVYHQEKEASRSDTTAGANTYSLKGCVTLAPWYISGMLGWLASDLFLRVAQQQAAAKTPKRIQVTAGSAQRPCALISAIRRSSASAKSMSFSTHSFPT